LLLYTLVKCSVLPSFAVIKVVACLPMVWLTLVQFPCRFLIFFNYHVCIMAMEAIRFHLFSSLCICLFTLLLYSH
jgi:hypothetical protein